MADITTRQPQCAFRQNPADIKPGAGTPGFTLLEMLVAIALLSIAMALAFGTFAAVSRAWQHGMQLSDNLGHGEYVMEQISAGLRSSFFPGSAPNINSYGLILDDQGYGQTARDTISWVKIGPDLLPPDDPLQTGPHRVMLSIEYDKENSPAIASRAWRPIQREQFFDPMNIEPFFISGRVVGFNCRVTTNLTDQGWEWDERWENNATNHLPLAVEITLVMAPLEQGEEPLELKRLVEIPAAELSWIPFNTRSNLGKGQDQGRAPQQDRQPRPEDRQPRPTP